MQTAETRSSGSKNKWLIGLGIGCGGVIVLVVVLFIAGFLFVKNITQGFRDTEALTTSLTDKYGRAEDYGPEPGGAFKPDRVEVFLGVREAVAPLQRKVETSFEELSKSRNAKNTDVGPSRNILATIRQGIGVVPQISDFLRARNQALLDKGMGLGEYSFTYVIAYYSWLKKSPDDGPGFRVVRSDNGRSSVESEEAREVSHDLALRRIHRLILPMLQKQLAAMEAGGKAGQKDVWREALAAEVKALEADRYRLPWQDGVPGVVADSLKPYRDRLETLYGRMTNVLELGIERR